jgi:hypothetical protein
MRSARRLPEGLRRLGLAFSEGFLSTCAVPGISFTKGLQYLSWLSIARRHAEGAAPRAIVVPPCPEVDSDVRSRVRITRKPALHRA